MNENPKLINLNFVGTQSKKYEEKTVRSSRFLHINKHRILKSNRAGKRALENMYKAGASVVTILIRKRMAEKRDKGGVAEEEEDD